MEPLVPLNSNRSKRTYIIAEMACSHEGDASLARKIIDGAGRACADAIQFQIWSLEDMVVPHHPDHQMLAKIELSRETWVDLARYVRQHYAGMQIIACVYERGSVDFGEDIAADAYKLHSADLSNPYLVEYVARTGKRIDLSVGGSTLDEVHTAIERIKGAVPRLPNIWLMYGYQNFPTRTDDVHLDYMMKLKQLFELPVGYQDHSDAESGAAFWLPAAAVAMGVDILEKHITHDRAFKGVDHQAALNPDEFARFVGMVREIERAKGVPTPKPFSSDELRYRRNSKKSVVARRRLPPATIVAEDDLLFMRAEEPGLPPDQASRIIGRTTKREVAPYHRILEEDVS